VEDMCNLVAKVLEEEDTPSSVQAKMRETYKLNISREGVVKILKEMRRRKS